MRPPVVRPPLVDALGALALLGLAMAEVLTTPDLRHRPALAALAVLVAVPVAWRRQRPAAVLGAVATGIFAGGVLAPEPDWVHPFAGLLVVCYSAAAYCERRAAVAGLLLPLAFFGIGTVLDNLEDPGSRPLGDLVFVSVVLTSAWGVGRIVRSWRLQAATLAARTRELEEEREWRARAAVAEERTRIARELHDIIAHSVSVMVVQAAAAEEVLAREPGRAREPLVRIQATGRQSVLELRRLLGVLRPEEEHDVRSPQPTLRGLDALVDEARASGLEVEVEVEGQVRELSAGLELTAYRVVQEALTNVVKHAGRAAAKVRIRYGTGDLSIDVVDHGGAAPAGRGRGAGLGLVGMRERVSLYGGHLETGPLGDGGFAVRATLPL